MTKRGVVFEQIETLVGMSRDLSDIELRKLRNSDRANARHRIDKIFANPANNAEKYVSSTGGNSSIYIMHKGRVVERTVTGVSALYLNDPERKLPTVSVYPLGIKGVTENRSPIFYDPEENTMRSIVLEAAQGVDWRAPWLQRPVEPLFNIDHDGVVFARLSDSPTPTELLLLDDILTRFEEVSSVTQ